MKNKKGFTLIELLVVMAIIAVLAALSLTGLGAARKAARDTQRKSDLMQYKSALEAYASNNGDKYPTSTVGDGDSNTPSGIFAAAGPIIVEYLPAVLSDPTTSATSRYTYVGDASGLTYKLQATLEGGGTWLVCNSGFVGKPTTAGACNF